MKLDTAIKHLEKNYERGKSIAIVRNPVAWALYQTWLEADAGEKRKHEHLDLYDAGYLQGRTDAIKEIIAQISKDGANEKD